MPDRSFRQRVSVVFSFLTTGLLTNIFFPRNQNQKKGVKRISSGLSSRYTQATVTPRSTIFHPLISVRWYMALFCCMSCSQRISFAQEHAVAPPKQEVRGVWITTAGSLDWPRSLDKAEQQTSLKMMVSDLKAANFNTIFFQVRARGDAYYKSKYEPWAENLTGRLGQDPGWDPLKFMLVEAHKAGMEVHAWFNVYKVRGANPAGYSVPPHPTRASPHWCIHYEGESWLDPGIPAVRDYLKRVALDLVTNYDIDGIMFDFIRYPGRDFADEVTYRRYGKGLDRDDWRRSNIDRFVAEFYESATAINPMLKIGSSPTGIYDGGPYTDLHGGYHFYYQDSQRWLRMKKHDYLAPQIYWDIGSSEGDPDFAQIAREWQRSSAGRHIYAGLGAFKASVLRELPAEIDTARSCGVAGQVFFRFEHIHGFDMLGDRYRTLATIPPMNWKDSILPFPPRHLTVTESATNVFHLEWIPPSPASDGDTARYYAVYRSETPEIPFGSAQSTAAITSSNVTHHIDTVEEAGSLRYYYAVSAFDKGNNESAPSKTATVVVKEAVEIGRMLLRVTSLSVSIPRSGSGPTLVAYRLAERADVLLELLHDPRAKREAPGATLASGDHDGGTYIVGLPPTRVGPGRYIIRLKAGEAVLEQRLELQR